MSTFVHRDLIAEKLEIARTLGLVTRYFVRPRDSAEGAGLSVRVWRSPGTSEQAIRHYLTRLLDGLISDREIVVTDGDAPARPERVEDTGTASVSAAA